jgi:DNA adenine methylase
MEYLGGGMSKMGSGSNGKSAMPPLLKWPGGKRTLIKHLSQHVPCEIERYYEPFLGGGALFFALLPM